MFGRKKCKRCGKKISKKYNFCPYCREPVNSDNQEDWGLLGKNDVVSYENFDITMDLWNVFTLLLRGLDEEVKRIKKESRKKSFSKEKGFGISIYTSEDSAPEVKISPIIGKEVKKHKIEKESLSISKGGLKNQKRFSGLPKKEPETNIRRLADKIVYEIHLPKVRSLKDVLIERLEDSIEVKALGEGCVYYKIVPLNLPIKKYNFLNERLVLEFEVGDE